MHLQCMLIRLIDGVLGKNFSRPQQWNITIRKEEMITMKIKKSGFYNLQMLEYLQFYSILTFCEKGIG